MSEADIAGVFTDGRFMTNETIEGKQALAKRKLLFDLMQLDIVPFKDSDVDRYKKARMRFHGPLGAIGDTMQSTVFVLSAMLVMIAAAVYVPMLLMKAGVGFGLASLALLVGIPLALALTIGVHAIGKHLFFRFYLSKWETRTLGEYDDDRHAFYLPQMPDDVRALAERIQAARPDVIIEVDSFKQDPFLVVRHPDHPRVRFAVAVWDEGKFRTTDR